MENRRNSLSVLKICRFCLSQDDTLTCIYDRNKKPKNAICLSLKILSCLSIEVFPSDRLPAYICKPCIFFIELFYKYKDICRKADESIMMHIRGGSTLEQTAWPNLLTKIFRLASNTEPVVNTVVEGATVQVTSQDGSDSEDEDEANIYNIKIGDESGEGSKRIKVITSSNEEKDKIETSKGRQEDLSYEADSDEEERSPVKDSDPGGCWPCNECDCTYPLQQLLELHKKMKHRARTVECHQCDQKFFSRNDLGTHMLRHTDEMPFQCVACDKKFKRLVHLKRHEKVMHSDIPQLSCPKCPATFLSLEELDAHQSRHVRDSNNSYPCIVCNKKFLDRARLVKHIDNVHSKDPEFRCEYCPAQFTSITKLSRHVRTHAGDRSYPCKYCDKNFVKSHHYTRHLRMKHRTAVRLGSGRALADANTEQFRCEQCSETFDSQDELIYHSAIHATQNLTCPLCQEKFDDVDAVTAHIKSHVNGIEFMCDLCELVFTSREKLDKHLNAAHAEELDQDESSMEIEGEEDEDDETRINVTEEDGEMVVEINKTDNFMLPEAQASIDVKPENTMFEESEAEITYSDLPSLDTLATVNKTQANAESQGSVGLTIVGTTTITKVVPKSAEPADGQTAPILRKAEEVKRKAQQITELLPEKKEKVAKGESSNSGASDKSLRLLEKELQELKRTNTRNEVAKTAGKTVDGLRIRRPQLHASTPKTRTVEQKKELASTKTTVVEKKVLERKIVTKENKEPKEVIKDTKVNATSKEEKNVKDKEEKKEEIKEKDTPKSVVKNGTSEKGQSEEIVRRSTRPSKIKDYAKMIRDKSQESDDDSDDSEDEEYKEVEKTETRAKTRRSSIKAPPGRAVAAPAAAAAPAPAARKRGRPRKEQNKDVPAKIKKDDIEDEEEEKETDKNETNKSETEQTSTKKSSTSVGKEKQSDDNSEKSEPMDIPSTSNNVKKSPTGPKPTSSGSLIMSPTGQTLKKVPIRALPPGIKPLPLPANARPMGPGELCEMQIGKKVVKVQKIVMTKAEVEAMAKKGLVEMKDGTMVLKQGIKLPTSDLYLSSLVATLGDKGASKESPKKDKTSNAQSKASD